MTKVYLVTRGEYSDYSVMAVFTDRTMANLHRLEIDEGNEVEERELVERPPTQVAVYNVSNNTYHGRGVRHEWTYLAWDYDPDLPRVHVAANDHLGFHAVRVHGTNQKAVVKAYDDHMARWVAETAGVV